MTKISPLLFPFNSVLEVLTRAKKKKKRKKESKRNKMEWEKKSVPKNLIVLIVHPRESTNFSS